ncbi:MAG: glycosyltransferase family 4 protein [Anaerolineae bacterium]|nr:glycosyltransferase family 4 protein [Anaerolineae bacterium]
MSHILFVTPAFPPLTGGGERYTHSLALALFDAGYQVTVVTSGAQAEHDFWEGQGAPATVPQHEDGLEIWRLPVRPFPKGRIGLLAWRKLMVVLSALPGDRRVRLQQMAQWIPPIVGLPETLARLSGVSLVHGFNISWEYALLAGWQFARHNQLPYVVTPFAHLGEARRARVARNSLMQHQRAVLADADSVHVLTRIEAEGFSTWGVRPRRCLEVGSGVDPVAVAGHPKSALAGLNIHLPFALFLGRATYDKGVQHAVQAVHLLRRQGTPIHLVLAGPTAPDFAAFYQRLRPQERSGIHQLGLVDETTKHALLAGATALLLPSRSDSFGIVLLEAWSHGTPVIGAAAGGIPGVVDHAHNGLLVPFGDVDALASALGTLLSDADLRHRLGRNGQEKVATHYTWARVRDRVLDSYSQLLV